LSDILLVALNARYHHTSFALRYLKANLQALEERCELLEFTLEERALDCVEKILQHQPRLVGFSVYIWNTTQTLELIRILRKIRPELPIVLGGPEVSYEWEQQEIVRLADYLVTHEGEVAFRELATQILAGNPPAQKVLAGGQPPIEQLALPIVYIATMTCSTGWSTWKLRGAAPSVANFAYLHWTSWCAISRSKACCRSCKFCWTGALASSSSSTAPSTCVWKSASSCWVSF
jgi:radical SAM superfamily enzyme YgiQ (UPF0313 family)